MPKPKKIGEYFWKLKRGECLFATRYFSVIMGCSHETVRLALNRLEHTYKLVDTKRTPNGTVVSLKEYDKLCSFDTKLTPSRHLVDIPKKDKKEEKENTPLPPKGDALDFLTWFNDRAGTKFQPLKQRMEKIRLRLSKFPLEELKQASESRMGNEFMMGRGENKTGKVYAHDIDSLIASDEKVDKWLNSHQKKIWDKKAISDLVLQFKHEGEPTPRYNELALHVRDSDLIDAFVQSRGQEWVDTYITPHLT